MHKAQDLITVFNGLFRATQHTVLEGSGAEPIYLPATGRGQLHRIIFTRDYYASALHEISHWCIAGKERRQQVDYGYWYEPDGRSPEQQAAFERVEVKPQALEWIFSAAAGVKFRVSLDNLKGVAVDDTEFSWRVRGQVGTFLSAGLGGRAAQFCRALVSFYNREREFSDFCTAMVPVRKSPVLIR